jgi:hypothetical protein
LPALPAPRHDRRSSRRRRAIGFELTPILKSLEPHRDSLVVVTGANGPLNLDNGGHAYAPSSWLTGATAKKTQGSDIHLGVSIDQVIAKQIGQDTVFPSLELATEDFTSYVGACETGFSCSYMNTISWSSPTTPLPMETNPRVVFERLFGVPGTPAQRQARSRRNRSILDAVMVKTRALEQGLAGQDRTRLADYLRTSGRSSGGSRRRKRSRRATSACRRRADGRARRARRARGAAVRFARGRVAGRSDARRIVHDGPRRHLPELPRDWRHRRAPSALAPRQQSEQWGFAKINTYETQFFSKFLTSCAPPDGDGSLLDHPVVFFGSGMSGGNTHSTIGLPIIIAGGGAGRIKGGRHLKHAVGPGSTGFPMGNVLLTIGQKMGAEIEAHGQSNGTIDL